MEIKLENQNHEVSGIVYPGTFQDLVNFLELKGIKTNFVVPGLKGSKGILVICPDDKTWKKAYDKG